MNMVHPVTPSPVSIRKTLFIDTSNKENIPPLPFLPPPPPRQSSRFDTSISPPLSPWEATESVNTTTTTTTTNNNNHSTNHRQVLQPIIAPCNSIRQVFSFDEWDQLTNSTFFSIFDNDNNNNNDDDDYHYNNIENDILYNPQNHQPTERFTFDNYHHSRQQRHQPFNNNNELDITLPTFFSSSSSSSSSSPPLLKFRQSNKLRLSPIQSKFHIDTEYDFGVVVPGPSNQYQNHCRCRDCIHCHYPTRNSMESNNHRTNNDSLPVVAPRNNNNNNVTSPFATRPTKKPRKHNYHDYDHHSKLLHHSHGDDDLDTNHSNEASLSNNNMDIPAAIYVPNLQVETIKEDTGTLKKRQRHDGKRQKRLGGKLLRKKFGLVWKSWMA